MSLSHVLSCARVSAIIMAIIAKTSTTFSRFSGFGARSSRIETFPPLKVRSCAIRNALSGKFYAAVEKVDRAKLSHFLTCPRWCEKAKNSRLKFEKSQNPGMRTDIRKKGLSMRISSKEM